MAKKKSSAVTHVPPVRKLSAREQLASFAAKRAKDIKNHKGISILFLLSIGALVLQFYTGAFVGSSALLYLFAFDGTVSGRMDANVLSRNGTGRKFTVPTLVQNGYTATARTLLALTSQAWAGLTQSEQDSWLNVDNQFYTNRLGVTKMLRGKALFCQRQINGVMVGSLISNSYPGTNPVISITSWDPTGATTTGQLTALSAVFSPSPTDANVVHLLFATAVQGSGINRPKRSAYRLIGALAAGDATPTNILALYTAKFGDVADVGQKIGLKLTPIETTTGQAGTDIVSIVTLT